MSESQVNNQVFWRKKRLIDYLASIPTAVMKATVLDVFVEIVKTYKVGEDEKLEKELLLCAQRHNLQNHQLMNGVLFILHQHSKEAALLKVAWSITSPRMEVAERVILQEVHHGVALESQRKGIRCDSELERQALSCMLLIVDLHRCLKSMFGYDFFKPGQLDVIMSILAGRNVIVVMPTSGGKTLCYLLPFLKKGMTIVVISSLLALTTNQMKGLERVKDAAGNPLVVARFDGTVQVWQKKEMQQTDAHCHCMYVTPESFIDKPFQQWLGSLVARVGIRRVALVVDEAHLLKEWSFRPAMKSVGAVKIDFPELQIVAMTATATDETKRVVMEMLHVDAESCKLRQELSTLVKVMPFNRPNVTPYFVQGDQAAGILGIDVYSKRYQEKFGHFPRIVVYCDEINRDCKPTAEILQRRLQGRSEVRCHHSEMSYPEQQEVQMMWLDGAHPCKVIVATIGFGQGVDAHMPAVFILDVPVKNTASMIVQMIGRAGRDSGGKKVQQAHAFVYVDFTKCFKNSWKAGGERPTKKRKFEKQKAEKPSDDKMKELKMICTFKEGTSCRRAKLTAPFSYQESRTLTCRSGDNVNFEPCDICARLKN